MSIALNALPQDQLSATAAVRMRPIVFLDFDGVLNSQRSRLALGDVRSCSAPDPVAVGLLNRLVHKADAAVVVSSAWRIGASLESLHSVLMRWRATEVASRLIGKTPEDSGTRGAEIAAWLAQHSALHDDRWVIVDDDPGMLDGQLSRFVKTSFRDGFGVVEYVQALRIIAPGHRDVEQLSWCEHHTDPPAWTMHLHWDHQEPQVAPGSDESGAQLLIQAAYERGWRAGRAEGAQVASRAADEPGN